MSRRLRRVLVAVALALLVLVGGSAAAWLGDAWLKSRIEAAVQRATGRALGIAGPLRVGWDLTVAASDVTLANMPGGSRPMMAQIGRVRAAVAFWPLLRGQFRVTALRLTDPHILVERDATGVVNWQLHRTAAVPAPAPSPAKAAARWGFHLDRLTTRGGSLAWHDGRHAVPDGQRPMPAIQATFPDGGGANVTASAAAFHAAASVGPEALRGTDVPFTVQVSLDDATASASGTVSPDAGGVAATVAIRAPDLGRLAALAGVTLRGSGPFSLDARLSGTRQRVALVDLRAAGSPGDVAGDLSWTPGTRPTLTGSLVAQRIDLAALRAMLDAPRPPPPAPSGIATVPPEPTVSHVVSDRPLPFAGLGRLDGDLRLRVAALANPDLRDLVLRLLLHDSLLTLEPLTASAGGQMNASLRIDARQPIPATTMTLRAPRLAVASLLLAAHLPALAGGSVAVDADLRATGRTPHELAAGLTGTAHLTGAGVTVDAAALADLLHAAHLPPLGEGGAVPLRCLAVGFDATHGIATVAPLLIDSGRLSLQGGGQVDLNAETLALRLRPMLRSGPGVVIPLRVSGNWRAPKLASDFAGTLEAGGLDPCPALPGPAAAAPDPPPPAKAKRPKPIDILRGLLR